jgi:hypothetical protein
MCVLVSRLAALRAAWVRV